MNKAGITTIGGVFLAGAMFHGGISSVTKSSGGGATRESRAAPPQKPSSEEGPWLASRKYWAESRWQDVSDKEESPGLHITLDETDKKFDAQIKASPDGSKAECKGQNDDGWGIPPSCSGQSDVHEPDVRAIIATVPDPIHSHFALEFDRTVDALMQAASDNGYLGSTYWLPWKNPASTTSSTEASSASTQTEEDRKREQQPGLIILKYNPSEDEKRPLLVRLPSRHLSLSRCRITCTRRGWQSASQRASV